MAQITMPAFDFFTGFYPSNYDDPQRGLCEWATKKAYLDMNRTLRFKKSTEQQAEADKKRTVERDGVIDIFYDKINELNNANVGFDKWHKEACDALKEHYNEKNEGLLCVPMTYGQAQKWLNMTLKYIWLIIQTNKDYTYYDGVLGVQSKLHAPLDRYILMYIKKEKLCTKNASLCDSTWSKIDSYDDYLKFQRELRATLSPSPIEWELTAWNKALREF